MSILTNIIDRITGKLPRKSADTLRKYGHYLIKNMYLVRTPIEKAIGWLMNILSKGEFEKNRRKYFYDNYFHLQLVVVLSNGQEIVLEKIQNVNIEPFKGKQSNSEIKQISYKPNSLSLNAIFYNAERKLPEDRIYRYNPYTANCQIFVSDLLSSSNLMNPELSKWINQNIAELVQKMPSVSKFISELATDVGGYMDKMLQFLRLKYKNGGIVKPIVKVDRNGLTYRKGETVRRTRDYGDIKVPTMVDVENPSDIEKKNVDRVPALLVYGELVVPRRYVPLVSSFLKSQGIKLNGMD
jgi:hypothetical protein